MKVNLNKTQSSIMEVECFTTQIIRFTKEMYCFFEQFSFNLLNGKGTMNYDAKAIKYEGEFLNGEFHG